MLSLLKRKMRRSTTETKTNRAERPKVVTREGKDKVTKTEVDVTKVIRNVGFYGDTQHTIGVVSLASDLTLGRIPAAKRQGLRDEMKKIIAELEKAKTVTPRIRRKLEAWNAAANAAANAPRAG